MTITKHSRVLNAFLAGQSHTRFTAERQLHDHCLHSTVSDLQRRHGIVISRERITIPGFLGRPTRCCRYWVEPIEIDRYLKSRQSRPLKREKEANHG